MNDIIFFITMKKKILFLGAAAHQISPILYARKKNILLLFVILIKKAQEPKMQVNFTTYLLLIKKNFGNFKK